MEDSLLANITGLTGGYYVARNHIYINASNIRHENTKAEGDPLFLRGWQIELARSSRENHHPLHPSTTLAHGQNPHQDTGQENPRLEQSCSRGSESTSKTPIPANINSLY